MLSTILIISCYIISRSLSSYFFSKGDFISPYMDSITLVDLISIIPLALLSHYKDMSICNSHKNHLLYWSLISVVVYLYNLTYSFSVKITDATTFELLRNGNILLSFIIGHVFMKRKRKLLEWLICINVILVLTTMKDNLTFSSEYLGIIIILSYILISIICDIMVDYVSPRKDNIHNMTMNNCFYYHVVESVMISSFMEGVSMFIINQGFRNYSAIEWGYFITRASNNILYYVSINLIPMELFKLAVIPSNILTLILGEFNYGLIPNVCSLFITLLMYVVYNNEK